MPNYEIRTFQRELEVSDDERVVDASISAQGCRLSSPNAHNFALVETPTDGDSEDDTEGIVCGARVAGGTCSRTVDHPDERCWQHEDG